MEDTVKKVLLEITPEYRINRILIEGADDSITEYRFSNLEENVSIPDSKFRFSAPAGAEIVEEEAGD
jgi:outer membrane lipoprotein-sorting protein